MSILSRMLGYVPREERGGLRLEEAEPWRVTPTRDVTRFLRALPLLATDSSIAYFEGTGEAHVAEHLRLISIPARAQVAVGTIWPRPDCYHVPVTADAMEAMASFLDRNPAGYFCTHCHVYLDNTILLERHDAFSDDPLYLSRAVPEAVVSRFAATIGSTYAAGWWAG